MFVLNGYDDDFKLSTVATMMIIMMMMMLTIMPTRTSMLASFKFPVTYASVCVCWWVGGLLIVGRTFDVLTDDRRAMVD